VLADGGVRVRVQAVAQDTLLGRMAAQLAEAAERAVEPTAADRIAPLFTALTLLVSALTFGAWWYFAGVAAAIPVTVAVLVVACPCALALSHPLAAAAALGATARRGLLFRSSDALLRLRDVDIIALDKTGTVTEGTMTVAEVTASGVMSPADVLRVAAGLERHSIHPIARAIVAEAAARQIPLPEARDVVETAGVGVAGCVHGLRWSLQSGGAGVVRLLDEGGHAAGEIRLADALRADAWDTVRALRADGREVVLLSGDHAAVAERMACAAGITRVHAGMRPEEKAAWIRERRKEGRRVLFAGDGLNDGPALAAADVGIAMANGAASSLLVADGVISTRALRPLLAGLHAAAAGRQVIRLSLRRSLAYNIVVVGAAAAGLINPLIAAVLMPLSSGLVIRGAFGIERRVRRAGTVPAVST
jgi:cation transport ATPase